MTARELGTYVQAAWATYEDMREQRDEARCRVDEVTDQRDQARRIAAALEAEVAKVRELHRPVMDVTDEQGVAICVRCSNPLSWAPWPCATASAVYLT